MHKQLFRYILSWLRVRDRRTMTIYTKANLGQGGARSDSGCPAHRITRAARVHEYCEKNVGHANVRAGPNAYDIFPSAPPNKNLPGVYIKDICEVCHNARTHENIKQWPGTETLTWDAEERYQRPSHWPTPLEATHSLPLIDYEGDTLYREARLQGATHRKAWSEYKKRVKWKTSLWIQRYHWMREKIARDEK